MKIILARHGESEGNAKGIMMSGGDWGLTPKGELQAQALAEIAKQYRIDMIYTSPVWRAQQTGLIISERPAMPSGIVPGLKEMDQGEFDGVPAADLSKRWPELAAQWWSSPEIMRPPGGETLQELQERAVKALTVVRMSGQDCALVVTHRYVLRVLCCWLTQIPLSAFRLFDFPTGAYAVVEFGPMGHEITAYSAAPHYAGEALGWPLK